MAAVLKHRGPDDEGQYFGNGVALGMRRLSIIDLEGGHQPICGEDGTVWAVCNGEIYNFRDLRMGLERRGHIFRSHSDTEVLVHLYEDKGLDFLQDLRGMFALALWDATESRLILARDRLGKKPLYISRAGERILFASEIKSLLQMPGVSRAVDFAALREYLAFGFVPAPKTLFAGIEKLLPGHFVVVDNKGTQQRPYWDVQFGEETSRSEEEWAELIREKLLESVRIRLVSDVPLGAFLSGGLASSAVVAAMSRLAPTVKTYSIGFEGDDQFYNELPFARVVANAFSTDHHEIIVRPDVAELLPRLIWHLDEPIADSAFITTYLVARLARESVTVILSGVGGDELFGGYRRYLGSRLSRYYRWLPAPIARRIATMVSELPQDRHSKWKNQLRYAAAFLDSAELPATAQYASYITVFSRDMRAQLLEDRVQGSEDPDLRPLWGYLSRYPSADSLSQIIYADIKTSLADDLLALTDKMTMAASIECRAPFLDQELVELAAKIPSRLRIRGLSLKYLLKKAVKPWLPAEIISRKKRGFGAPMGAWLRKDLRILLKDTLSDEQVKKRGYFNPEAVQELIRRHEAGRNDYTDHLLGLVNFEIWCRVFLDSYNWQQPAEPHSALAAQ